jgi:hypothetical protein
MDALFLKLTKVDEATRTVWGIATAEKPDLDNEICDYPSAKNAYRTWSEASLEKTKAAGQEPSLGNVRIMHGNQIGGKVTHIDYDDANKTIRVASTPASDEVWNLLKGGFLTGYSHGGKKQILSTDGRYRRYAPQLAELSYVDKACLDEGFEFVKSDGAVEMRKFTHSEQETIELNGRTYQLVKRDFSDEDRKKLAGEGKALPDGSFPIENDSDLSNAIQAIGRAKDPEEAKAHIRARAKALGRTDLLPDSWGEKSEKLAKSDSSKEHSTMDENQKKLEELQKSFDSQKKDLDDLKKMSEAHQAHMRAIGNHLAGAMDHVNQMCDGEKMVKDANVDPAPAGFVSMGKTAEGIEIFKKVPIDASMVAIEALEKRVKAAEEKADGAEKLLTDLNKGIKETLEKGVKIPGVANAAGLSVVSKEKDGADDKDKQKEDLTKVYGSAAEAAKDPAFLHGVSELTRMSEVEFFTHRAAAK